MTSDVNAILKVYLGTDERGGYMPGDGEERLRRVFPDEHVEHLATVSAYLSEDHEPTWKSGELSEETRLFEAKLQERFPELERTVIRALANRWSYGWR